MARAARTSTTGTCGPNGPNTFIALKSTQNEHGKQRSEVGGRANPSAAHFVALTGASSSLSPSLFPFVLWRPLAFKTNECRSGQCQSPTASVIQPFSYPFPRGTKTRNARTLVYCVAFERARHSQVLERILHRSPCDTPALLSLRPVLPRLVALLRLRAVLLW